MHVNMFGLGEFFTMDRSDKIVGFFVRQPYATMLFPPAAGLAIAAYGFGSAAGMLAFSCYLKGLAISFVALQVAYGDSKEFVNEPNVMFPNLSFGIRFFCAGACLSAVIGLPEVTTLSMVSFASGALLAAVSTYIDRGVSTKGHYVEKSCRNRGITVS